MECKCKYHLSARTLRLELIDTLWNVNLSKRGAKKKSNTGINRYIMECKL